MPLMGNFFNHYELFHTGESVCAELLALFT
jgi:hypothetical protein